VRDLTIAPNKLKKKFKKETLQKFTSKTFEMEKTRMLAITKLKK